MPKRITYEDDARFAILRGVNRLTAAVRVTLGPKGRNVVIDKPFGSPVITKDGATVANEIELPDPLENIGARMVREVTSRTSDIAGDGTTTATVLAQSIYRGIAGLMLTTEALVSEAPEQEEESASPTRSASRAAADRSSM